MLLDNQALHDIVTKTVDYFDALASTSYAVFDNNYKYIYDKYNDVYRYIPCNGDMAGLVLSTTLNSEAWLSPAGFNRGTILNAIKLAYSPLKDHRDRLYAARVNPIVAFPVKVLSSSEIRLHLDIHLHLTESTSDVYSL